MGSIGTTQDASIILSHLHAAAGQLAAQISRADALLKGVLASRLSELRLLDMVCSYDDLKAKFEILGDRMLGA